MTTFFKRNFSKLKPKYYPREKKNIQVVQYLNRSRKKDHYVSLPFIALGYRYFLSCTRMNFVDAHASTEPTFLLNCNSDNPDATHNVQLLCATHFLNPLPECRRHLCPETDHRAFTRTALNGSS